VTTKPFGPGSDGHEARLLPTPTQRALPSDRSRSLKERVMTEIQQSTHPAEQSPRMRHRLLAGVSALGAVAAAAVTAVALMGGGTPAYALTSHSDGSISVQIKQLRNPRALMADLARHGVTSDITYLSRGQSCAQQPFPGRRPDPARSAQEAKAFQGASQGTRPYFKVYPAQIPSGTTLVLRVSSQTIGVWFGTGPVTPCAIIVH